MIVTHILGLISTILMSIFYLLPGLISGFIAWKKNKNENLLIRVLITIFAFFFNYFYLVYYLLGYKTIVKGKTEELGNILN